MGKIDFQIGQVSSVSFWYSSCTLLSFSFYERIVVVLTTFSSFSFVVSQCPLSWTRLLSPVSSPLKNWQVSPDKSGTLTSNKWTYPFHHCPCYSKSPSLSPNVRETIQTMLVLWRFVSWFLSPFFSFVCTLWFPAVHESDHSVVDRWLGNITTLSVDRMLAFYDAGQLGSCSDKVSFAVAYGLYLTLSKVPSFSLLFLLPSSSSWSIFYFVSRNALVVLIMQINFSQRNFGVQLDSASPIPSSLPPF